eukprot:TRINITY_DN67366_c0_g1_i1.p2 TRINITY_DN67366_c0_g1~~TRINITY_DN67366_c0_g1_i1.p2  ORF type:complete len:350 (-),score=42.00 TRINITY_DN67366_c0_g1_i1:1113-2162(-)
MQEDENIPSSSSPSSSPQQQQQQQAGTAGTGLARPRATSAPASNGNNNNATAAAAGVPSNTNNNTTTTTSSSAAVVPTSSSGGGTAGATGAASSSSSSASAAAGSPQAPTAATSSTSSPSGGGGENTGGGGVDSELVWPELFAAVDSGVYRCKVPSPSASSPGVPDSVLPFLSTLQLKSIIFLAPDVPPMPILQWANQNNLKTYTPGVDCSTIEDGWKTLNEDMCRTTVELLLNSDNLPCLLTCTTGIILTGTIVALMRQIQRWSKGSIVMEMDQFCAAVFPKTKRTAYVSTIQEFLAGFRMMDFTVPTTNKPAWLAPFIAPPACKAPMALIGPETTYGKASIIDDGED